MLGQFLKRPFLEIDCPIRAQENDLGLLDSESMALHVKSTDIYV